MPRLYFSFGMIKKKKTQLWQIQHLLIRCNRQSQHQNSASLSSRPEVSGYKVSGASKAEVFLRCCIRFYETHVLIDSSKDEARSSAVIRWEGSL